MTLHDERFVHPNEVFHPRQGEQIVADGDLAGGGKAVVNEEFGQESRIEHNVAMIAHKGVATRWVDGGAVHTATFARGF